MNHKDTTVRDFLAQKRWSSVFTWIRNEAEIANLSPAEALRVWESGLNDHLRRTQEEPKT
jgi:hypothetical protein